MGELEIGLGVASWFLGWWVIWIVLGGAKLFGELFIGLGFGAFMRIFDNFNITGDEL